MNEAKILDLKPALAEKAGRDAAQAEAKAIEKSLQDKGFVMAVSNRNSKRIFNLSPAEAQRVVDFFRLNPFEIPQIFAAKDNLFSPEEVLTLAQEALESNENSKNAAETRSAISALLDLDFEIIGRCLKDSSTVAKFPAEDILKIRDYLYNKRNQQKGVLSEKEAHLLQEIENIYSTFEITEA